MVITLQKGQMALYMGSVSEYQDEEEILLPHNCVFFVQQILDLPIRVKANKHDIKQANFYSNDTNETIKVLCVILVAEPELLPKFVLD